MRASSLIALAATVLAGCASGGGTQSKACMGQCTLLVTNRGGVPLVIEAGTGGASGNRQVGVAPAGGVLTAILPQPPTRVIGTYTRENDMQRYTTICRYDSRVDDEVRYTCQTRNVVRQPG
jgi:hypothetical protein